MTDHARTVATAVDLLNAGDVDGYITTLYAEAAVFHGFPPQVPPHRDGIAGFFRALRAGVPTPTSVPRTSSPTGTGSRSGSPCPERTPGNCSARLVPAGASRSRE